MKPPGAVAGRIFEADSPRWLLRAAPDTLLVQELSQALVLPESLSALLVARGFSSPEAAKSHLRPRLEQLHLPDTLRDIATTVSRLLRALDAGETILVHGDYDVDGVASAALYTKWLRRLGGNVRPFVPHRLRDGYDFGAAGLDAAREAGASLILTSDCGIVAHEPVAEASREGIDVLVTDHHTPGDSLPPATAVVNPSRLDCPYPNKALCGTGVAFKVLTLLLREAGVSFDELVPDLDLVALATVADLVPLRGENRVLVRFGLRALRQSGSPGIRALLEVTGLAGKPLNAGQVAFGLAPRINAAGRMGDADDALRLFLTEDRDEARQLAAQLHELNAVRQEEDRRTLDEALEMLAEDFDPDRDFGVVLAAEGWHPGVIGIVASRVVERIHRPTVMVALEEGRGRGSARSIPGFHLYDALRSCGRFFDRFGGHAAAAGMELSEGAVSPFRREFANVARKRLSAQDLRRSLRADLEAPSDLADLRTAELLAYLGPHGMGNPRPVFLLRDAEVKGDPRVVGKGHLKLRLERDGMVLDAIGFGLAERRGASVGHGSQVDALFNLDVNEFRGSKKPQARLIDLRLAGSEVIETEEPAVVEAVDSAVEAATESAGAVAAG